MDKLDRYASSTSELIKVDRKKAYKKEQPKKLSRAQQTALLREALQQGFEQQLRDHFLEVVEAVVEKAKKGDMKAAQMIMDRVVPTIAVEKGMEQQNTGIRSVNIVIGTANGQTLEIEPAEVIDVDPTE